MTFTSEEKNKLKTMMKFLVKRRHVESNGRSGFNLNLLTPILDELEEDGEIKKRQTINSNAYFINN